MGEEVRLVALRRVVEGGRESHESKKFKQDCISALLVTLPLLMWPWPDLGNTH